jgi:hypothetical protein
MEIINKNNFQGIYYTFYQIFQAHYQSRHLTYSMQF